MKKVDPTLFSLCLGIFLYGVVIQIVMLFFTRRADLCLGLWIGVVLAVAGSVHMYVCLNRSLEKVQKDAQKQVGANNLIRYAVLVMVMAVLVFTDIANPLMTFCGYMGMKVSAYLNPYLRKVSEKLFHIE